MTKREKLVTDMTSERLAEIRSRLEAQYLVPNSPRPGTVTIGEMLTDIADLLAEVERLREEA